MAKFDWSTLKVVVLVEGQTEQILLPEFARACGLDLVAMGVMIIPTGGAKNLLRKYQLLKKKTNLPIFCLFDHDAGTWAASVSAQLRKGDQVYVLADGEIEDTMSLEFFVNQLNAFWRSSCLNDGEDILAVSDFSSNHKRTLVLDRIWRQKQLGKFEKIKFAQFITGTVSGPDAISPDAKHLFAKLSKATFSAAS